MKGTSGVTNAKPRRRSSKDQAISLQLELDLKRKLIDAARKEDRSISHIVRLALRNYFEQREKAAA